MITSVTDLMERVNNDESEMLEFKESYGSGIQRIFDKCHELGFPEPVFKELDGGFQVTFHKRFIEWDLPLAEISEDSAREKNIRHGHISTFHIWWARRPLASSRATNFAALIDPAGGQRKEEGNNRANQEDHTLGSG